MEKFDYTKLSLDERMELAHVLLDSIDEEMEGELAPEELAELDRRLALMESGQMPMHSWDEVKQRLRQELGDNAV